MQSVQRVAKSALGIALVAALGSTPAAAQSAFVDADNCPGPGAGTDIDPYCKIQDAICFLKDSGGGTVTVRPGTYNESIRMFPGVSVVSSAGPRVTTIDGEGKPLTTSSCLPSTNSLSSSTVVFGSGSTNADRLEGFRIIGGSGLFRDFGSGVPPNALTGGGIFVFDGSPTITNNEIIGNSLVNANPTDHHWGGGIYLDAAIRWGYGENLTMMFILRDLTGNFERNRSVGREFEISYIGANVHLR